MKYTERCEGIKASGERCKCYGVMQVNNLWYCKIHGEKELRAIAKIHQERYPCQCEICALAIDLAMGVGKGEKA